MSDLLPPIGMCNWLSNWQGMYSSRFAEKGELVAPYGALPIIASPLNAHADVLSICLRVQQPTPMNHDLAQGCGEVGLF